MTEVLFLELYLKEPIGEILLNTSLYKMLAFTSIKLSGLEINQSLILCPTSCTGSSELKISLYNGANSVPTSTSV